MLEVPHEICNHEIPLRDYILACLLGHRAKPYLPFTCAFLDHHLDALTERVAAPKLVTAVAVAVYSFLI